jgi:glycosyltransferase involved in cell wall biosynthesis
MPRVLFLSRWLPYPPDNGSKIRIYNILRQLSARNDISLIALAEPERRVALEARRALGKVCSSVRILDHREFDPARPRALAGFLSRQPRFLVDTYQPAVAEAVADEVRRARPDVVVASQLDMLPYALRVPSVPLVLEELELSIYRDAARRGPREALTWLKLATYLRGVLPRLAACTVASEAERVNLRRVAPNFSRVLVVPNAVDVAAYTNDPPALVEPDSLIFSGALTYHANHDAMQYFVGEIYPRIRAAVPGAHLRITGGLPADPSGLPDGPGVELTGYVPDVHGLIARSALAVVPLRVGGGTRLKILEAMALGTPVVSTPKGAEGLAITPGQDILLADTPAEFAAAVVRVLGSADLRSQLSLAGRQLVESRYDWPRVATELTSLVERAA